MSATAGVDDPGHLAVEQDLGNRDVGWREHAVQRHQPLRSSVIGSISREDFALIAAQVNLTDCPAAWAPHETQDPPALRLDRRAPAMRLSIRSRIDPDPFLRGAEHFDVDAVPNRRGQAAHDMAPGRTEIVEFSLGRSPLTNQRQSKA